MQSQETVVYVVSGGFTNGQDLAELFRSYEIRTLSFQSAEAYSSARRLDKNACLIFNLDRLDAWGFESHCQLMVAGGPPVIFVATHADPVSCIRAVKAGAIDVLVGPINHIELMASVKSALTRDAEARTEEVQVVSLITLWRTLTPREMEVFHHTVAGLLNKQAAAELGVAENTYQVHRGRVMRKMKADSLADLVRMSTRLEPILKDATHPQLKAPLPKPHLEAMGSPAPFRRAAIFHSPMSTRAEGMAALRRF